MDVQEACDLAATRLASISSSAHLDAQLLICHACGIEHAAVLAHPQGKLSQLEVEAFNALLERRSQGEPLAYITGKKEFFSLEFMVNNQVLIPRPETELLVETALGLIENMTSPRVLDLGTGSGAIAISIAKQMHNSLVTATDISAGAIEVAKLNAARHEVCVTCIQSDWYLGLGKKKFDVIVSNPPYVAENDPGLDRYIIEFEPSLAVISAQNGLHDIRQIIEQAPVFLRQPGYLIIEHGFEQADDVRKLFRQHNFQNVRSVKDLAGHPRVTCGYFESDRIRIRDR